MVVSGRSSKISSIVAALCIVIYIAAIAFGAVQIIVNIGERRTLAETEFYDLADRASSSAVFLGFMSGAYQETLRDFLSSSETLLGIIITGSNGEYAFDRYPGSGIVWTGDVPRLKTGAGFPREPFYLPLRIEGQRNVTIQAVYNYIDNDLFLAVLRNALLAVMAALSVAFITLLLELILKKKVVHYRPGIKSVSSPASYPPLEKLSGKIPTPDESRIPDDFFSQKTEETDTPFGNIVFPEDDLPENPEEDEHPTGLYTPRGNIGWESYTHDRLDSELHRCASFEQDLTFLVMESGEISGDSLYRKFTEEAVKFFAMRDLIFEKGERGISVIIPNVALEEGMTKAEGFRSRLIAKLPECRAAVHIGLSSRSGRLIEANRLMLEAATALRKAMEDPVSPIIAFKSDPEKYREYIKENR